ncbi:MAG TPA: glycoside hydrolase 100 family protein [Candidatus Limnocylindria bacterium]|nr:glycoside hydrolase 100 family protein [Candidatus Limnocylindria bacterium]
MTSTLVDVADAQARDVLRRCVGPYGLRASADAHGYREVWARDAMISLLGICAVGLEELVPVGRLTLETLTRHQSALGRVPLNVGPDGRTSTANAGAVDSNLWYVIGHYALRRAFGADDLFDKHREALARAMLWARYQDSDEDGLIESHEAANWADLIAYRGKVLYDNVVYLLALSSYASLAEEFGLPEAREHRRLAQSVADRLNALHWVESNDGLWDGAASLAVRGDHTELRRVSQAAVTALWSRPYYLPWVGFRDFGDWCDVLGNCLAILAGVADAERGARILRYFDDVGVTSPFPAKALHPPIEPGHKDWRDYYRNGNRNVPGQYQNGGSWPFIGGFLVAAQVRAGLHASAALQLGHLAASLANENGEWEFNEWHHSATGRPMGARYQAWSAGMFLYAHAAVATSALPIFGDLGGRA